MGLPDFIQSYFATGSFTTSKHCYQDSTAFVIAEISEEIDSVVWDFDDPGTGAANASRDTSPYHIYSSPGAYTPRLLIYLDNGVNYTIADTVHIISGEKPQLGPDREVCDSISVNLSIVAGFSSIRWSTGPSDTLQNITVTTDGTYIVNAKGAGQCPGADTIRVKFNRAVLLLPNDTIFCQGDSVQLDAGNAGYRYIWSNGDTTQLSWITQSGLSTVKIYNGACSWFDSTQVTVIPKAVFTLGNDTLLCPGQSLRLKIPVAGTYLWSTGAVTDTLTVTNAGTYTGQVQTMCGLVSDTIMVKLFSDNTLIL